MSLFTSLFALSALLVGPALAQTFSSCNPLNSTCPSDPALSTNHTFDFTTSEASSAIWNTTAGSLAYGLDGAHFVINNRGDAPTIQSNFYLFFGVVEVWMKAATGQGVVSSIVLESDDLDEVDWEILGGNTTDVQTNYFGKGNTTSYDRAIWYPVEDPQADFHNYTTRWTAERLEWFIDGAPVRTLEYADANGGKDFPQTPMNVRLGVWAAGDSANNKWTIQWAGGVTDYSKGPYTMIVRSARVTDFSSGSEYRYGDATGNWQSIDIVNGTSSIAKKLSTKPSKTLSQRWASLSRAAQIAIVCAAGGIVLAFFALFVTFCIRQRRAGRRVRAAEDAQWEKEMGRSGKLPSK